MTDKQIIIDGIDVSGCTYYMEYGECINENIYHDYCKACSNCTYKLEQQLKRKEQECEELRKQLDIYLNQEEEDIRQLNNDNKLDNILSAIEKANDKIEKEINYKQALDEIEKIVKQTCSQRCTNDCLGTKKHCGYGHILNIINKVKER